MTRRPIKKAQSLPVVFDEAEQFTPVKEYPSDWRKGALLNVRNGGEEYIVTLYPEEYDPQHPERCITFTNVGECQKFISDWYARESHDPRAR